MMGAFFNFEIVHISIAQVECIMDRSKRPAKPATVNKVCRSQTAQRR
jgi:hypothetical protein